MSPKKSNKTIIGISVGDLNGIGYEVILKSLSDNRMNELGQFVIYGSKQSAKYYQDLLGLNQFKINAVKDIDSIKGAGVQLVEVWKDKVEIQPGQSNKQSGQYAHASLKAATQDLKEGKIHAMVTAPIDKDAIQSEEFDFPGHTEYLQKIDEAEDSLMLMISQSSRIGLVSGHLPLKEVAEKVDADLILRKLNILNKSLKEDFRIGKPKIAILGLNPHAGDNGLLGEEEQKVIIPAINQAKSIGILAFGPYPADGFFASSSYNQFDAVLAMYHDQGLIASKMLSFGEGTNYTAGLSFVRTSPDHGTAMQIAGKGEANEGSFRTALYQAIEIAKNRKEYEELTEDQFSPSKNKK